MILRRCPRCGQDPILSEVKRDADGKRIGGYIRCPDCGYAERYRGLDPIDEWNRVPRNPPEPYVTTWKDGRGWI